MGRVTSARPGLIETPAITPAELQLATRNHGMPLEALRWPVTPLGLHYLLVHFDIPAVDAATWSLDVQGAVDRQLTLPLDESSAPARPARSR